MGGHNALTIGIILVSATYQCCSAITGLECQVVTSGSSQTNTQCIYSGTATMPILYDPDYIEKQEHLYYIIKDKLTTLVSARNIGRIENVRIVPNTQDPNILIQYDIVTSTEENDIQTLIDEMEQQLNDDEEAMAALVGLSVEDQTTLNSVMATIAGVTGLISIGVMIFSILNRLKNVAIPGADGEAKKEGSSGVFDIFGGGGGDSEGGDTSPFGLSLDIKPPTGLKVPFQSSDVNIQPLQITPLPEPPTLQIKPIVVLPKNLEINPPATLPIVKAKPFNFWDLFRKPVVIPLGTPEALTLPDAVDFSYRPESVMPVESQGLALYHTSTILERIPAVPMNDHLVCPSPVVIEHAAQVAPLPTYVYNVPGSPARQDIHQNPAIYMM